MLIANPPAEIADHLVMLGTNEYPLYLCSGESKGTIFEGGIRSMGPLLARQLEQRGIAKDFVRQVVITHAHPDHVMAVPLFREMFPGITVFASETATNTLSSAKAISFFCKVDDVLTGSLLRAGQITEEHRTAPLAEEQIAIDRVVKEGDTITVDAGRTFTVLETPGHSACSLSFHDGDAGVLLISDATGYYMPEHGCWWPNYFDGYSAYLGSMERLAGLSAEVLCLSHNGVIKGAEDVKTYFDGAIAATKEYHQRILDEVRAGKTVHQIAEQLGSEVYEKTQLMPVDFFQKSCGLLVKQSLRYAGLSA